MNMREETIMKRLLLIKIHYFCLMAAMGPVLSQIFVFGKYLDISPDLMGYIACVMPLVYVLIKLIVNFLVDYFTSLRHFIFILIIGTTLCSIFFYTGFTFFPFFICPPGTTPSFDYLTFAEELQDCSLQIYMYVLMCNEINLDTWRQDKCDGYPKFRGCYNYMSVWRYVLLLSAGTIGLSLAKGMVDAVYFDVIGGAQESKYGSHRLWGTIGFGTTALLGGILVNFWTMDILKNFRPVLVLMTIFGEFALPTICGFEIPELSSNSTVRGSLHLLRQPKVALFLVFPTIAGILDSFVSYFIFWHLEDVARMTGHMGSIKLIEGCVIGAGCLCGEVLIIVFSGKIIKRIGYVHCLSLCFFLYTIRLALISQIDNPWFLVGIELVMQGGTHALTRACLNAYASGVAPLGASILVQDLGSGMRDILGYFIGPLVGGNLYRILDGPKSFLVFSGLAAGTCVLHILLRPGSKREDGFEESESGYDLLSEEIADDLEGEK